MMPLKRSMRPVAKALAVCALALSLAVGTMAPAHAAAVDELVALGDSYASGVGTRSYYSDSGSCYRSPKAYPVQIASGSGIGLDFQACSGAATADVRSNQVQALSSSTDYVTITVGGNDVNFVPVLTECAKPSWWGHCNKEIDEALLILNRDLPTRLRNVYADIKSRAPQARVVVTGYPLLFNGTDCNAITFFSPGEERRLNDSTDLLNNTINQQVTAAGFTFADPRAAFADHAVCDDVEYINGASWPLINSFHPNVAGQTAYARVVAPALAVGPSPASVTVAKATVHSASRNEVSASGFTFKAPDLGSRAARTAAQRAGISLKDLNSLHRAQQRGMSSTQLDRMDRRIAAKAHR